MSSFAGARSTEAAGALSTTGSFAYLLSRPLAALTREEMESVRRTADKKRARLAELELQTPTSLWLEDIAGFEDAWHAYVTLAQHEDDDIDSDDANETKGLREGKDKSGKRKRTHKP